MTQPESKQAVDESLLSEEPRGAVPPMGGAPAEDAPPANAAHAEERSAAEDLVDGIDLMLRAARKTLRSVDPRIEQAAERAVTKLQQLDANAAENFRQRAAEIDPKLGKLAGEAGREIVGLVERL